MSAERALPRRWTLHLEVIANGHTREEALAAMQRTIREYVIDPEMQVQPELSLLGLTCEGFVHEDHHVRRCGAAPPGMIIVWRHLRFADNGEEQRSPSVIPAWLAVPSQASSDQLLDIGIVSGPPGPVKQIDANTFEFDGVAEDRESLEEDELAVEHPDILPAGSLVPAGTFIWRNESETWCALT